MAGGEISLSTTAYNNAARCLKRYEYRHELNLIPRPPDVRPKVRRGTWIHRCLQLHDLGLDWAEELARMADWAIAHEVDPAQVEKTHEETRGLVSDYIAFWGQREHEDNGPFVTVASEIPLEFEPIPGLKISATLDRIARDRKNRLWIWERKSTEEMPDSDWRNVDPQTLIQLACARLGHQYDISGIVFDYVRTDPGPQVRVYKPVKSGASAGRGGRIYDDVTNKAVTPRAFEAAVPEIKANWQTSEYPNFGPGLPPDLTQYIDQMRTRMVQPEAWFQRYPVLRPDESMTETLKDVAVTMGNVRRARKTGHYARSVAITDCRLFCPYMKLCFREYQLGRPSQALREELFVIETPELRNEGRSEDAAYSR
jgi:PD-(D/E)XK nuclease superfamily